MGENIGAKSFLVSEALNLSEDVGIRVHCAWPPLLL